MRLFLLIGIYLMSIDEIWNHVHRKRALNSHVVRNAIVDDSKDVLFNTPPTLLAMDHLLKTCTNPAVCVLLIQCPAHLRMDTILPCYTSTNKTGVCCTTGYNHSEIIEEKTRGHDLVNISPDTLKALARSSRSKLFELQAKERRFLSHHESTVLHPGSASYGHFRNSRLFNAGDLMEVMDVASRALEIALATKDFKDRQGISVHQLEYGMIQKDLRTTQLGFACSVEPTCSYSPPKYRRIDGSCNNFHKSSWGMALTPYTRLLPPSYHDGIWEPRRSVTGKKLPSPRLISSVLVHDHDIPNNDYTLLFMQFGQFITHDLTQSIDTLFGNGSAISCCTEDGSESLDANFQHYACMPILIPEDDYFYSIYNQKCINFVRSIIAPRSDCTLGYGQQMNKLTHFIDASSVYGSKPEQTAELRSFSGGKLRIFKDFGRQLLPLSNDPKACLAMERQSACFFAGDTRSNQIISLVAIHMLWLREHNRLAEELNKMNPHWDDEKVFLEARQILIAEMQVIIYKEWLPAVIGKEGMEEFDLGLSKDDEYSFDYDANVDPSVINEFAAAALRFGHSMVDGLLRIYGKEKIEEFIAIPEVMFDPARLRLRLFFDELLSTLSSEPIQEVDISLSDALTKYMFRGGTPFGVDLAALNIQRGRDHGIRPYNDYRELIGLPRVAEFSEFGPEIGPQLARLYESVDDIDLWIGGLLEPKAPGAIVGHTFRDIIAEQFHRLKQGDRYFFENHPNINPGFFSLDQLKELKKASISRIICDNSDGILLARQTPNAFRKPNSPGNEYVHCASTEIPRLDLIYWKE